ncbi:NUDIX hydrolase [Candidatus Falkowbacteria bacterium CG11_big_fil_rev_8_21_14_0_20_39_10]|uniref:NUDIX hydrolase n=1 Tax=Candidatus Falkowbacteria bacterium CG11_big_fil_rev_8_21_14_0_20_39_10 TaxID=1974570 RepID=A0A2M6K7R8_9BACT|nr:MAG: NUDIX hydrolase [Candidatus Falkowbacteria bacterium CG11_big_fil_rev_8_21_14_0_20_39_10]
MPNQRFKITPAVYLILEKDKKILLLRRINTGFEDGKYSLVAGHVKRGESVTAAMVRETEEEVGIKIMSEDLKFVHVMHRFSVASGAGQKTRVDFFLKADKWTGEPKNLEPKKCDDLNWFDINNLPKNIIPYVRQAIVNVPKGVFYSEWG